MLDWREKGYIWGDKRDCGPAGGADLINLVTLPRFPEPRPFRINIECPPSSFLSTYEVVAEFGIGDATARSLVLSYNVTTGIGEHVLYASSLHVKARVLTGGLTPAAREVLAWATPVEDGGISLSRPKPFGTAPVADPVVTLPQAIVSAIFANGSRRRRLSVANYQGAGTANLLLAYGRTPASATDFDVIVPPNVTHIEEGWDGLVSGIWDAAGVGFARIGVFMP